MEGDEIVDGTCPVDVESFHLGAPNAQWRLSRLEALTHSGSWVWHLADDTVEWSDALLDLFGMPRGSSLDYPTYRSRLHPDDIAMIESTLATALATGDPFTYTHRMFLGDGVTERVFECFGEVITGPGGEPAHILGTARDVTEAHWAQRELAYLAEHDPLTGVANRRRVTARLVECALEPGGAALILLDADNFKDVNDLRGHAAGDLVIREIARTVRARLPADALLGRLGGDEFAVVLPAMCSERALEVADDLCGAVGRAPVVDGTDTIVVTISAGVTVLGGDVDVETGLARADLALYEAKRAGRNRACLFAHGHYEQAVRRVSILARVGAALDAGTFGLDAQPIVDLATGRVDRHEVLLRLRDGLDPALGPAEYLPAVERTDLIWRLDRWVVGQAVAALARGAAARLEVNVSARSLDDPDLGSYVLGALRAAGVQPSRLGLEITETAAIANLDAARTLAVALREAGCAFSLDDFGAGFASFSHLKHLPFTTVKIAGEFVRQVDRDPVDRAMVTAVVGVARELGMRTVAEHVDRAPMVDLLRSLGVDDGQGFLLGRPRPLVDLPEQP